MRIHNLNPGDEIGASGWYVETDGSHFLLDAGLHPKLEGRACLPTFGVIPDGQLDAVLISHCHYDHVAGLPVAVKQFPRARVMMSELSAYLVERVLHNSANVMKRQRDEMGILDYPLYDNQQVEELAPLIEGIRYREPKFCDFATAEGHSGRVPQIELYDAGHTLGAAGISIRSQSHSLFYTGDCSFQDQILLKGADFSSVKADVVIMETTRGSYDDSKTHLRSREVRRLREAILEVQNRRGCVLIPSFALGRTQEILALLAEMVLDGVIPRQPIYIGGLGKIFTDLYDNLARKTNRNHPDMLLNRELNLVVQNVDKVRETSLKSPKIFVMTAGMMNENTVAHDLAIRLCADPKHAIFFVGYADPSTPGGKMRESEMGQPFYFSSKAVDLVRHCELRQFDVTGHANRDELVRCVDEIRPRHIVLGHGDPSSRQWFFDQFRKMDHSYMIHNPGPGECIHIPD